MNNATRLWYLHPWWTFQWLVCPFLLLSFLWNCSCYISGNSNTAGHPLWIWSTSTTNSGGDWCCKGYFHLIYLFHQTPLCLVGYTTKAAQLCNMSWPKQRHLWDTYSALESNPIKICCTQWDGGFCLSPHLLFTLLLHYLIFWTGKWGLVSPVCLCDAHVLPAYKPLPPQDAATPSFYISHTRAVIFNSF